MQRRRRNGNRGETVEATQPTVDIMSYFCTKRVMPDRSSRCLSLTVVVQKQMAKNMNESITVYDLSFAFFLGLLLLLEPPDGEARSTYFFPSEI